MISDLIVSATPLVISGNFEEVKSALVEGLKEYEIEVTEENLPEAKKMAAELNKLSTSIKRTKIDKGKEFSIPIEQFRAQAEELEKLAQSAREKILEQVRVFEDKTRKLCRELMETYLKNHYAALEVREEFQTGFPTIESLVGISMVTGKGVLTKAGRESVEGLAQQGRSLQLQHDGRIDKLTAKCLSAGLETALQKEHVAAFLHESDAIYDQKLDRLIKIEVERQEKAKAAVIAREKEKIQAEERAKAKAEADAKAHAEKVEREEKELRERAEAQAKIQREALGKEKAPESPKDELKTDSAKITPAAETKTPGDAPKAVFSEKIPFLVTAIFEVNAKPEADTMKISKWFEAKILEAGLNELRGITVFPK